MPVRDGGPCYVEHGAVVAQASDDCQVSGSIPDTAACEKKYNQLTKVVGRLSIDRRLFNT